MSSLEIFFGLLLICLLAALGLVLLWSRRLRRQVVESTSREKATAQRLFAIEQDLARRDQEIESYKAQIAVFRKVEETLRESMTQVEELLRQQRETIEAERGHFRNEIERMQQRIIELEEQIGTSRRGLETLVAESGDGFVVGGLEQPLISLLPVFEESQNMRLIPVMQEKGVLEQFLSMVPRGILVAKDAHAATSTRYVMKLSKEASEAIASGQWAMMGAEGGIRGNVVDAITKKVRAQAILQPDNLMKVANAATAAWQIAAMLTAQKFLADIEKRLGNLERGISEILQHLFNEQSSALEAIQRSLLEIHSMGKGNYPQHINVLHLELLNHQRHQVFALLRKNTLGQIAEFDAVQSSDWPSETYQQLQNVYSGALEHLQLLVYACAIHAVLRVTYLQLPGVSHNAAVCMDEVEKDLIVVEDLLKAFKEKGIEAAERIRRGFFNPHHEEEAKALKRQAQDDIDDRKGKIQGEIYKIRTALQESGVVTIDGPAIPQPIEYELIVNPDGTLEAMFQRIPTPQT